MKRLMLCLFVLCLLAGVSSFAAEKKTAKKPAAKEAAYVCTMCKVATGKAGKCPDCGMDMMKSDVSYTCAKCKTESAKPGKCPKCKAEMVKTATVFHCDGCGKDFATGGN